MGEHANAPVPVVDTEKSACQLLIVPHAPHTASVPVLREKRTGCLSNSMPSGAAVIVSDAVLETLKANTVTNKSAYWAVTVRPARLGEPPNVHKFVAHVGSVLILKRLASPASGQANTPFPVVETEKREAQSVIVEHPPHVAWGVVAIELKKTFVRGAKTPTGAEI